MPLHAPKRVSFLHSVHSKSKVWFSSIPSAYVHSLECFISAKRELLAQGNTSTASKNLSIIYDYQQKYVSALVKQLPPGSLFPTSSSSVRMHPPSTVKASPMRQGPFLLQPSPRILDRSEGGEATDLTYLAFGDNPSDDDGAETEHLGVMMVVYQDGKVDLCLDVEKVEARWDSKVGMIHSFQWTQLKPFTRYLPESYPCWQYTRRLISG